MFGCHITKPNRGSKELSWGEEEMVTLQKIQCHTMCGQIQLQQNFISLRAALEPPARAATPPLLQKPQQG